MPAPRPQRTKRNIDHVVDVVQALEAAKLAIGRLDEDKLSTDGRKVTGELSEAIKDALLLSADAIEVVTNGTLTRRRPPAAPLFQDGRS